jgi:hypothetical protein
MALPWKLKLISFRPYFQYEHVHGPLTIRPSSIRLHLNASVRDRTVPWTWPLVWTLLLIVSEEFLKGSWPERDYSSAVNQATLTTEPKTLAVHTVCHIHLCFKLQSPQDWLTLILLTWRIRWAPNNASKWQMGFNSAFKGLMHLLNRNVQDFLFMSICNFYCPFNQQSKLQYHLKTVDFKLEKRTNYIFHQRPTESSSTSTGITEVPSSSR